MNAAPENPQPGRVVVVTGAMAAGKSTVADLLAHRFERSVHIRGDYFRRMIVNGREELELHPSPAAVAQLELRYDLAAACADSFAAAGFTAVVQDVIIGRELPDFVARITTHDRFLVVLSPSADVLALREQQRPKHAYQHFTPSAMDDVLRRDTERMGYWLDSSAQTPEETVEDIWTNLERARV